MRYVKLSNDRARYPFDGLLSGQFRGLRRLRLKRRGATHSLAIRSRGVAKRAFDTVAAGGLLVFFSPIFVLIGVSVIMADGRGMFYAHERVGKGGQRFNCLKFRSMRRNSEELLQECLENDPEARAMWETHRKLPNDPRVIPVIGTILRKSSLDELPQLINVLRGEMSVVGPRPVTEDELPYYGDDVVWYASVRPGITGQWQISGRSDTSYDERVRLDKDYARNWTLGRDIGILLKTPAVVLRGDGAY